MCGMAFRLALCLFLIESFEKTEPMDWTKGNSLAFIDQLINPNGGVFG